MTFGQKKEKELLGLNLIQKLKMLLIVRTDVSIKWFYDGTLNASANCIDRHLKKNKDKTAIIWVGDDPKVQKRISYKQLHDEVLKRQMD